VHFVSVTVAMLICTHWRIYLPWYAANTEVGVQQANGADCRPQYIQRALSLRIVAGRPGECKKK